MDKQKTRRTNSAVSRGMTSGRRPARTACSGATAADCACACASTSLRCVRECLCVCNRDDATDTYAAGRMGGRASGQWSRMAHAWNAASEGLPAAGWSLLPVRKRVSPRPPLSFVNDASSSATIHRREKPVVRCTAVSLVPTTRPIAAEPAQHSSLGVSSPHRRRPTPRQTVGQPPVRER